MSIEEIFAQIEKDVSDVYEGCFGLRDTTIWMTKDLFNRLLPGEFVLQKDSAMTTLFGCRIKVVIFPCAGMQWIVGYEGKAEGGVNDDSSRKSDSLCLYWDTDVRFQ